VSFNSITTVGNPIGVSIIVSAFILTGIYVHRANGEFDELNATIVKKATNETFHLVWSGLDVGRSIQRCIGRCH